MEILDFLFEKKRASKMAHTSLWRCNFLNKTPVLQLHANNLQGLLHTQWITLYKENWNQKWVCYL